MSKDEIRPQDIWLPEPPNIIWIGGRAPDGFNEAEARRRLGFNVHEKRYGETTFRLEGGHVAKPDSPDQERFGNDFDLLCQVARETGVTMEDAARTLEGIRGAGLVGSTTVTFGGSPYVGIRETGTTRRPLPYEDARRPGRLKRFGVWALARLLNLCGWKPKGETDAE